jgi:hypothetical protein
MKDKVKDVYRSFKHTLFQHDDFFNGMRHGIKRGQKHQEGDHYEQGIGYSVHEIPHRFTPRDRGLQNSFRRGSL